MPTTREVLTCLKALADPQAVQAQAHFGVTGKDRLGLSVPQLRAIAKDIRTDHALALDLWNTAIPDARILATLIADPARLTPAQMDAWTTDFTSWDVCDAACTNIYVSTPHAWDKVYQWAREDPEFTRRAGFVLIACLAVHDKSAPNDKFTATFALIKRHAVDPRNFVRKAVNWALRGIGKRNLALNQAAVVCAEDLLTLNDRTANWIARDALRELNSEKIIARIKAKPKGNSKEDGRGGQNKNASGNHHRRSEKK